MSNFTNILITDDNSHTLYSERFDAHYHSLHGSIQESMHVFIINGFNKFIANTSNQTVSVLEVGFGTGLNAFLTLKESSAKSINVNYHAVEAYPLALSVTEQLNYGSILEDKEIFTRMHASEFEKEVELNKSFKLTKHHCLLQKFQTTERLDIIYFDAFSPRHQPELWTIELFSKLFNNLNSQGILVTYCAQGEMKRNLKQVGFKVIALPGSIGKREMTLALKE